MVNLLDDISNRIFGGFWAVLMVSSFGDALGLFNALYSIGGLPDIVSGLLFMELLGLNVHQAMKKHRNAYRDTRRIDQDRNHGRFRWQDGPAVSAWRTNDRPQ